MTSLVRRPRYDSPNRMGIMVANRGLVRRGPLESPAASRSRIMAGLEQAAPRGALTSGSLGSGHRARRPRRRAAGAGVGHNT